jgi:autoinducer 2-degrading protein
VAYVVTATWTARQGEEATVETLLARVAAASRMEPGCLLFWTHRSVDDPGRFFLYEQYASEAAFLEHAASEHVRTLVLEDAVNRLDERCREMYETLDA